MSKQAIFSLHRGNIGESDDRLRAAKIAAEELMPVITRSPALRQGAFSNSMEEYAEALILRTYVVEGRVPTCSEVALADVSMCANIARGKRLSITVNSST